MLSNCLKKLGKQINSIERAELEEAFGAHTSKGLSEYDASMAALADFHKGVFDSVNELRRHARMGEVEYKPVQIREQLPPSEITPEQRATEYAQAERDLATVPAERRLNPRDATDLWTPERREQAKTDAIARVSEGAEPIELRQVPREEVIPPSTVSPEVAKPVVSTSEKLSPEKTQEAVELLEDVIKTKKANRERVPEAWIQRLGELRAQQKGESASRDEFIFADESVSGHPFNSERPVLPIKIQIADRSLGSIKSYAEEAQQRFDEASRKLNAKTAKGKPQVEGANRTELEVERDNMRAAQTELGRLERKLKFALELQSVSPERSVQKEVQIEPRPKVRTEAIEASTPVLSEGRGADTPAPEPSVAASMTPLSRRATSGAFQKLVRNADRNDINDVLDNWSEARLNDAGDGIIVKGQFRRNAPAGEGPSYRAKKDDFISWLMSNAPFDPKVYGEGIAKDVEWRKQIETLRKATDLDVGAGGIEKQRPVPSAPSFKGKPRVTYTAAGNRSDRSLSQFVRAQGGIVPGAMFKGELDRLRTKDTGTTGLINQHNRTERHKMTADNMMEAANEAGFGPYENVGDFLYAIERDVAGQKSYVRTGEEIDWNAEFRKKHAQEEAEYNAGESLVTLLETGRGGELFDRIAERKATDAERQELNGLARKAGVNKQDLDSLIAEAELDAAADVVSPTVSSPRETRRAEQLGFTQEGLTQESAPPLKLPDQRERLLQEQKSREEAANPERTAALKTLAELKAKGMTVDDYARQGSLLGEAPTPEKIALLRELEGGLARKTATDEQVYDASLGEFRAASKKFNEVTKRYRAKEINDAEFIEARKEFDAAREKADAAETAFIDAKNTEQPSFVTSAKERQANRAAEKATGIEYRRAGADPYELVDDIIVRGWDLYSQKVKPTFEEWSRKLKEEFGPESESHLKKVWAQLGGPETTERVRPRQGERSFPETVEEAGYQGGENRTYDILPNVETMERANATIKEKGVDLVAAELQNRKGEFTPEDVATGSRVIQIYEEQGKMGKAIETAENLAEELTKAGQTVQAASIIARLSPEGTLLYAQRKLPAGQKLTPEQGEKLVGQAKKVRTLEDSVKAKDAEATIAELQEQVKFLKKSPRPRVVERAKEKIGTLEDRLTKMEVAAQARLTQAFGGSTFRSGIDPVILKDLAVVGAVKVAKKGMNAAKWELEMIDKFGEKIKPHLKKIYQSSFKLYDSEKKLFRQEQLERSALKRGATPETLQREINTRLDEMSQLRKERAEMQAMFNELDQTKWGKRVKTVFDATGIPHAVMTAFDLSFGFRQGKMGLVRHPKAWTEMMKRQVKALDNTEFSRMVSELEARPNFKYYKRFKLELTSPAVSEIKLATKEEGFQSRTAEKIPGIRRSEQAFSTAGDWMRAPWFDDYIAKSRRAGFDPENPADFHVFEDGARLVNAATGRGNLGKYGNAVAPILNRATFSARFWASRVKMLTLPIDPRTYTTMSKPARVEALKTVFGFYALVGAQLTLAKATGATVGTDPDKPDFMKASWGPVHVDFSAGHQSHFRFAARLIKAIYEEQVKGVKRNDYQTPAAITGTYLRGKEAPLVSLAHDTLFSKKDKEGYGTDIIGRSSYLFGDPKASKFDRFSGSAIMRRLEPLIYQDAKQAYDQMGWKGVGIVTPLVGIGESVQTYPSKEPQPSKFPSARPGAGNVGRPNIGARP